MVGSFEKGLDDEVLGMTVGMGDNRALLADISDNVNQVMGPKSYHGSGFDG